MNMQTDTATAPPFIDDFPERDPGETERNRTTALTKLLRGAGAVLLMSSAATFLLQRWNAGDDIWRYSLLVVQSVVLVLAAILCAARVRESRGARTLFALSLAMLPAHFGVLGGLIYSRFQWDDMGIVPWWSHARWVAPSDGSALMTLAVALALLAPMAHFALLSLVRSEAPRLLGLLFALNALLLVPVRDPRIVGVEFAVAVLLLAFLEGGTFRRSVALGTLEGKIVRLVLAAPPVILAVRALVLYSPTELFMGTCLASLGVALFALAPALTRRTTAGLQAFGATITAAGWLLLSTEFAGNIHVASSLVLPLVGLPLAGIFLLFGKYGVGSGDKYRVVASVVAVATVGLNLLSWTVGASLSALVLGLLLLAVGTYRKRLASQLLGGVLAVTGLLIQLHQAIDFSRVLNWGSLSLLGVALIFVAAYFERHPERLASAARSLTQARRDR